MNVAGIDSVTEWLVALASFVGAVKFLVLPVRKTARFAEANKEVTEAQLRKNGGGSLTDKVDAIYQGMFEVDEHGQPVKDEHGHPVNLVKAIRTQQIATAEMNEQRHAENVARMDGIEKRQDAARELFGAVVSVFSPETQKAIREIVEAHQSEGEHRRQEVAG